ncbi:galactokinase [Limnochorda pilosa]|uniref:Galactokinase n=2 Tax=Limnochorda pilosa TaxID=1555112 RepID=A0A0K2SJ47_LIMPI|nr:galactokinase [Limnochorda pilosa]
MRAATLKALGPAAGGDPRAAARTVAAPGRVNLIGEHTDYNDGFVLPAAIDRWIVMSGRLRSGREVRVLSLDRREQATFSLEGLHPRQRESLPDWTRYVAGALWSLQVEGLDLGGMELAFTGSVPQGMGLSSSAALEVATGWLALGLNGEELPRLRVAQVGQRAENLFVGVRCGIMDQFASALGREGHALLLDCRSLEHRPVAVPEGLALFVVHPPQGRTLAGSGYNLRRQECEVAARMLAEARPDLAALRDATPEDLRWIEGRVGETRDGHVVATLLARARHVVAENQRVHDAVAALEEGDMEGLGRLVAASHASLRDLFEVSTPDIDRWVERLSTLPGCLGARVVGGGFGGSILALARGSEAGAFQVRAEALAGAGQERPRVFRCRAAAGVGEVFP